MKHTIPSYESFRWRELWRVTERRQGLVFKTEKTEWHVPSTWEPTGDWITAPFSTTDTKKDTLTINPHPEFK
jgi:hypothetical protein